MVSSPADLKFNHKLKRLSSWSRGASDLEEQSVDHDQVPHSQLPSGNALGRHEHGKGQRHAEDHILAPVEE